MKYHQYSKTFELKADPIRSQGCYKHPPTSEEGAWQGQVPYAMKGSKIHHKGILL